jgi:hypothetical protein
MRHAILTGRKSPWLVGWSDRTRLRHDTYTVTRVCSIGHFGFVLLQVSEKFLIGCQSSWDVN